MSQTATPAAAPPPPPAAAPASAAPAPAAAAQPGTSYVDTPALLNRWQLIGMSVAIVFGIVSALLQFVGWQADGRAADDTEQLIRVQEVKTSLLRADALATNAFLKGGLEDPAQREEYDVEIDGVLGDIANAAEAQSADRNALSALNVEVTEYATAVAQGRDNNRQNYPIGAEYLNTASAELRATALPILDELIRANQERAEGAMNGQHPIWLFLLGVAVLVALVWLNRELARHFRRRINKGIAVAAIIVLAVTLVTAVGAWVRDSSNDGLREGEFATAVSEAHARTAGNDAKALESLRLIKRGSGATYENDWTEAAKGVADSGTRASGEWSSYAKVHEEIVALDDAGSWQLARKKAIDVSGAAFQPFDDATRAAIEKNGEVATDDLRSGRWLALVISALTLLLGVAAAVAVARGIGERRREFS
ncbi:hypothetical protein KVF89_08645 [Nocardioides carbamazepini]|uniref:hypothetical protein n=1 Tax=Nocardioides carbamazepini TaxID=2854259 RepID=UPI00214A77E3|nr:hypothetical protein [Nocardioides carbamazepini]MCR1782598.1 hypothetical protein [Nocardioides carbamazepini]